MSEFDELIALKRLSERTRKNYLSQYNVVTNHLTTTVANASQPDLVAAVVAAASRGGALNPRSAWTYSNTISQILKMKGLPNSLFENERTRWKRLADNEQPDKIVDEVADLPQEEEVVKFIRTLHGKAYVLNRLIYEYALRNKDVRLKVVSKDDPEDATNWFNYKNGRLHIGDYKTNGVYGAKDIRIKPGRLRHEAKSIDGEWLVPPDVDDKDLTHHIAPKTYKGMGQNKYFKIRLMATNNAKERIALGITRGTSIGNINRFYNGKRYVGDK